MSPEALECKIYFSKPGAYIDSKQKVNSNPKNNLAQFIFLENDSQIHKEYLSLKSVLL